MVMVVGQHRSADEQTGEESNGKYTRGGNTSLPARLGFPLGIMALGTETSRDTL